MNKMLSVSQMQKIFNEEIAKCKEWKIPIAENIAFRPELSTASGYIAITEGTVRKRPRSYLVIFSTRFYDIYKHKQKEAFRNVLMHELCHTILGCLNHSAKWKKWIKFVNENYGYKINWQPYSRTAFDNKDYPY